LTCNIKTAVETPSIAYFPFFGASEALTFLVPRSFFARFLRSLRNLRDAFSTLDSRPDRTKRYLGSNFLCTSSQPPANIYVLDSSPILFQCASGRAAGFISKDWFDSSLLELGKLSFRLHRELADRFDGRRHWGYSGSVALSLDEPSDSTGTAAMERRGEDWLFDGQSRGLMACDTFSPTSNHHSWPQWLKKGDGRILSTTDNTAQVDPKRFCEFLLNQCKEHNVTVLHPATATSLLTNETGLPVALSFTTPESSGQTIPCTSLLLAAGPWTGRVYQKLFPKSQLKLPISNLAGWSVVFRDPTPSTISESMPLCHSAFTTSASERFSPEVFSRIAPSGHTQDIVHEIYLAGLNSSDIPLPNNATEVESTPEPHSPQISSMLKVAKRLFSSPVAVNTPCGTATKEGHSIEVLRTALCHRPVTPSGRPILTQIDPQHYAPQFASRVNQPPALDTGMKDGGVYVCAGHGPWGIALSLGSGRVCADLMMSNAENPVYLSKLGL